MTHMTRRQVNAGLAAVAVVGVPGIARAHHGWGGYDSAKVLNLTGTIKAYKYINPHGELQLATADKEWLCTLAPPFRMQNRGLTEEFFKIGAACTAVGYPNKTDPNEMRAERITVAGKTVELR
jgi:hypothetical protein